MNKCVVLHTIFATVAAVGACLAVHYGVQARQGDGVLKTIMTRTSIRAYDSGKPVNDATVEKLLRAAMAAPTAVNLQPWHFIVVRDHGKLLDLAEAQPNAKMAPKAALAIVVCGDTDNGLPGEGKQFWIQDCAAASENILIAAHALGLGAVWTGVYPLSNRVTDVRKVLAIPDRYLPLNIIPIGWPAENPPPRDKWKAEKIHREKW